LTGKISKTQIDRLGDRLRQGPVTEADLRNLDEYRRSFGEAYEIVVRTVREKLQLEPTGRPAKSTSSIIEKLHRESIRLSQMQDIAGCRVVVADVAEQERVVVSLCNVFPGASVVDRRANPSYGYRAVHIIVEISGKLIEIQIRSSLQHSWAEVSEKLSDAVDPSIKYGGGADQIRQPLTQYSELVADLEECQVLLLRLPKDRLNEQQLVDRRKQLVQLGDKIVAVANKMIDWVENLLKGQEP
jgi:putative GTP pyrophosphokinase